MNEEPTVLDYVKSLLSGKPLPIPEEPTPEFLPEPVQPAGEVRSEEPAPAPGEPLLDAAASSPEPSQPRSTGQPVAPQAFPWHALVALALALVAQLSLEPRPNRTWILGAFLYFIAGAWVLWAGHRGEWALGAAATPEAALPTEESAQPEQSQPWYKVRTEAVFAALVLIPLAFVMLGGNRFTSLNLILWLLAVASVVWAFWLGGTPVRDWGAGVRAALRLPWKFSFTGWSLAVVLVLALVVFFRTYQLVQTPPEMVSDQAEKLLDVWDVLHGQTSIFFPRNTGREAFQMYLTAAVIKLFGTGFSFLSLKIGTVLCGLLTLPFIYGLGKELGGRRAGLFALALAGVAYWPNVISRVGLRFTLYAFFTAPVLYYLLRGLRARSRNDLILAGIWLGLGLHGYSPFRIVPFVVVAAFVIYLLHCRSKNDRQQAAWWLAMLALVSLLVFLPLLRYALENPEMFSYRALTRLGSLEQPLPGPAWLIFLKNLWNALVMFAWDNGEVWVVSVTHRPALELVSAVLFHLGLLLVLLRYLRRRDWRDLFILLSIPMLLLPSIMALAFPAENPILNRTSGALVPVFVIVGLALDGLLNGLQKALPAWGSRLGWGLAVLLIGWSSLNNYDLVFNQYQRAYELSSWNTSEMSEVVRDFGVMTGSTDTAWVVAYPYWVDTRLVGMSAGLTTRDMAIWPEHFVDTLADPRPKLFLVKNDDVNSLSLLQELYPQGSWTLFDSRVDKDFFIFFVPPASAIPVNALP